MKVTLDFENYKCVVEREVGDPRFHRSGYTLAESTFLYHVMQEIKKQGHDVIKKRMRKDGHLVDDTQQYIRTRKFNSLKGAKGEFCIYNKNYAIYDAGEQFNEYGRVILGLDYQENYHV